MTTVTVPSSKPTPKASAPSPTYKQLSWTLKFEGDAFKVPDVKSDSHSSISIKGSYDLPVVAAAGGHCAPHETVIDLSDVPQDHPIVVLILKVDPSSSKDVVSPLEVVVKDAGGNAKPPTRWLSGDPSKPPIVFSNVVKDQLPFPSGWSVVVKNENPKSINLLVQVAYGPKS